MAGAYPAVAPDEVVGGVVAQPQRAASMRVNNERASIRAQR